MDIPTGLESASERRERMVQRQIEGRGITDRRIVEAMRRVPRERFVPPPMQEFAYDDTPLPIEGGRTLSSPYLVATMIDALRLPERPLRVLEIGTGSGYRAALLAELTEELRCIERDPKLAALAAERLRELGHERARVREPGDTPGWPDSGPYDAILVAEPDATPPTLEPLLEQLVIGGRLVVVEGEGPREQRLRRITRESETERTEEDLGPVAFVPLVRAEGEPATSQTRPRSQPVPLLEVLRRGAEPFDHVDDAALDDRLDALVERVGDARVVCLGEATHGTSEFYRMRARLSRALIERKSFGAVAIEGDWPDVARIDHYVRDLDRPAPDWQGFARFPTWMWRNREVREFVDWLREHNLGVAQARARVGVHGLDLYSLHTSIARVLEYLDEADPQAAAVARQRYGCLTPWQQDPAAYGLAALTGRQRACEGEVVAMLSDLLRNRLEYSARADGERFFDASRNAALVAAAEQYYRTMYYGSVSSWNLRDSHMFETLTALLEHRGPDSKVIVWAHNTHVGDASATEMGTRGEHDLGQLCRQRFGDRAYLLGFGTDHGIVAAASDWGGPMEHMELRPAHERSYEHACHRTGLPGFFLPLRTGDEALWRALQPERLQRAVGVIYRPQTELASHYFGASLPRQFDEFVWIDETSAVHPLQAEELHDVPDTYPFGL